MLHSPFSIAYDSDPYDSHQQPMYQRQHQPSSYNHQRRRRYLQQLQAAEEAQSRQAEAERRHQQATRQEYLKRLQEEETYRRAYEAAKRRREMLEEAKNKQEQVQDYLFGNDRESDDDYDEEEAMEPVFRIMQGSDGRLYKVKVGEKLRPQPNPRLRRSSSMRNERNVMASSPQQDDGYQFIRSPEGRIYRVQRQPDNEGVEPKPSWLSRRNHIVRNNQTDEESPEFEHGTSPFAPVQIPIRPSMKRKKVTVVVEDASDSESEDLRSSEKSRLVPSPGQWMEPVKST